MKLFWIFCLVICRQSVSNQCIQESIRIIRIRPQNRKQNSQEIAVLVQGNHERQRSMRQKVGKVAKILKKRLEKLQNHQKIG